MPPARSATSAPWLLIPIVIGSGFAGLGYEIVWTRMLSLALGTEMMAVLGVVSGFFGGLALGAFVLDGPIRRAQAPKVAYAILEGVIGLWGVASVFLLPAAGRALPPLLGAEPAPAVLWAAGFLLPALALLPATVAMGGTLTALEQMAAAEGGRRAAGIYGGNTAGGVAGVLAATFVLMPALGLSGTLLALAALNGACGLAALAWGSAGDQACGREAPIRERGLPAPLAAGLFVTGLLGVAFEVLIVRLAAQVLQDTIYSFASLLAAYLLGTAAGGLGWQRVQRGRPKGAGLLLALTSLACLATALLAPWVPAIAAAAAAQGVAGELAVAMVVFLLPSAAMGALFGALAQAVRDTRGSLGWAVGVNSLGAAIAPMAASLVLIPVVGVWKALLAVALAYLLLVPLLATRLRPALAACVAPAILGAALWLRPAPSLIRVPDGGSLVASTEGPMATASVVDDASGARYLEVNGHFRMGGTSSVRSDYRQAMVPLLMHQAPHRALFLGVGTGATLAGGALMPGLAAQGVELSREVTGLLQHFTDPAAPLPRVVVADARRFIASDTGRYDVIVADLYHPALDGSGALYTTEHFAAIRSRLAEGGLFCQWLPLYQLDEPSLRTILRTFLGVFPAGAAWLNHYSVGTPMLALAGGLAPLRMDPDALARRLAEPGLARVLTPLGLTQPIDLLGQFVGGASALAAYAGKGQLNTDDYPAVALDAGRNVRALSAPPAGLLLSLVSRVHPRAADVLAPAAVASWAPRLSGYWQARDRFLQAGASLHGNPRGLALVAAAAPGLLDAVRLSPEFEPAYQPLLSMARVLAGSDRQAATLLLRQINEAAPFRGDARALLSQLAP